VSLPRVLIIGVGSIGHRHLRCFLNTGRVTAEICEVNNDLAQDIAAQYGITTVWNSLDDAIASPPDLAVICAPAHLHIEMAITLANHGVDILIEKPLSTSLNDIDILKSSISTAGVCCGVAYVTHQHPVIRDVKRELDSGRFGKPLQINYVSGQHFPYYRPAYREIYYTDRATGGGCIQDAITHSMNTAELLVGPITKLTCDADHLALEGVTVEDTVHVITRHGEIMGSLVSNQFQSPNESTFIINCEKGTIKCLMHEGRWVWHDTPETQWREGAQYDLERDDLFVKQANMFLDAREQGDLPSCTLEAAIQTLKVNLAMLESSDTHTWQTIN